MKQANTQRKRAKARRAQVAGKSYRADSTQAVLSSKARYGIGATGGKARLVWSSIGMKH